MGASDGECMRRLDEGLDERLAGRVYGRLDKRLDNSGVASLLREP